MEASPKVCMHEHTELINSNDPFRDQVASMDEIGTNRTGNHSNNSFDICDCFPRSYLNNDCTFARNSFICGWN
jgi:hypothetical protein